MATVQAADDRAAAERTAERTVAGQAAAQRAAQREAADSPLSTHHSLLLATHYSTRYSPLTPLAIPHSLGPGPGAQWAAAQRAAAQRAAAVRVALAAVVGGGAAGGRKAGDSRGPSGWRPWWAAAQLAAAERAAAQRAAAQRAAAQKGGTEGSGAAQRSVALRVWLREWTAAERAAAERAAAKRVAAERAMARRDELHTGTAERAVAERGRESGDGAMVRGGGSCSWRLCGKKSEAWACHLCRVARSQVAPVAVVCPSNSPLPTGMRGSCVCGRIENHSPRHTLYSTPSTSPTRKGVLGTRRRRGSVHGHVSANSSMRRTERKGRRMRRQLERSKRSVTRGVHGARLPPHGRSTRVSILVLAMGPGVVARVLVVLVVVEVVEVVVVVVVVVVVAARGLGKAQVRRLTTPSTRHSRPQGLCTPTTWKCPTRWAIGCVPL